MAEIKALLEEVRAAVDAQEAGIPNSRDRLLKSVEKLSRTAQGSAEYVTNIRYQPLQHTCIVLAGRTGALQALVAKNRSPITVKDLAAELHCDESLLGRVLRLLGSIAIVDETGANVYASNANTEYLNTPGLLGSFNFMGGVTMHNIARASDFYKETGFTQFADDGKQGLFDFSNGMSVWEYFRKNPDKKEDFDGYMMARRQGFAAQWFEIYPAAAELGPGFKNGTESVFMVDVGGNTGHDLMAFRKKHPELPGRFILQDLKETFDSITTPLDGIESMVYDFFTPQPVKGARAYFFRAILHDWSDAQCRQILKNTAAAMTKGYSRLLIEDWVIPTEGARFRGPALDILMMCNVSGIERTLQHWHSLLESAGLVLVKVWPSEDQEPVIEAILKE